MHVLQRVPVRLAVLLVAAGLAVPAGAQRPGRASIVGTVRSEQQAPIAEAEITVLGPGQAARSSASGAYRVDSVPAGRYMVQVRRLGFKPLYYAVTLKPGERRDIDVELAVLPTQLSAVQVRERSGYSGRDALRLRDFEWRRRTATARARFLTRDDLTRYRAAGTLLSALRSEWPISMCLQLVDVTTYSLWADTDNPLARGACRVAVSVDGGVPMDAAAIDYPLSQVEAVEMYRNGIGAPIEFQTGAARGAGVIVVIWTGVDTDR
jgi:hypothetical protein